MTPTHTKKTEEISIVTAIETLSKIADLELTSTLRDPMFLVPSRDETVVSKTVRWLHKKNAETMSKIVNEKLKVVLNYFKNFYKNEKDRFTKKESLEGIQTIMLLIDDAADNIDRYTKVFLGAFASSIRQTKVFEQLCSFYKKKIGPIITHQKVAYWITGLTEQQFFHKPTLTEPQYHLTVDLDSLKNDLDYELLFLKDHNGVSFLTPSLINKVRLAVDFARRVGRSKEIEEEIFATTQAQSSAEVSFILDRCYDNIDKFFHEAHSHSKDELLIRGVYDPCIALMTSAIRSIHLGRLAKGSIEYFEDFKALLNHLIYLPDFQRLLAYPPTNEHSWEFSVFRLIESFSEKIIEGSPLSSEMFRFLQAIIQQGIAKIVHEIDIDNSSVSYRLKMVHKALFQLLGDRKELAFSKTFEKAGEQKWAYFDPIVTESIPTHLSDFQWKKKIIPIIRMPSPTHQEYINKASISELFQIAIRKRCLTPQHGLIINFQDRTSWKERARCQAIEELCKREDLDYTISTLTLSRNNEFYDQTGPYETMNSFRVFKESLVKHFSERVCGTFIPKIYEEEMLRSLGHFIEIIHQVIFKKAVIIHKEKRLICIDLCQSFLILKMIDLCQPNSIFITCKDGLESAIPGFVLLYMLSASLQKKIVADDDLEWLQGILFGIPLAKRGRLLFAERYQRLFSSLQILETLTPEEVNSIGGAISHLFPHQVLLGKIEPKVSH